MVKLCKFNDFIDLPVRLLRAIGKNLFEHRSEDPIRRRLDRLYLYVGIISFNLVLLGEVIFVVKALGAPSQTQTLEATACFSCICFAFLIDIKLLVLVVHNQKLLEVLDQMEAMFPCDAALQRVYDVSRREHSMRHLTTAIAVFSLANTTTYSIYPVLRSAIVYLFHNGAERFERSFCFFVWYPFDPTANNAIYALIYLTHIHRAYFAGVVFTCSDLLLISMVTQLCMHLDHIAQRLLQFDGALMAEAESAHLQLQQLVQYHAHCLELCESVNKIFSFSLMLNFLMTSLTICLSGFQMTAALTVEDIVRNCLFLLASLLQVFVVCACGETLMMTSKGVGDAVYNSKWHERSARFRHPLIYIIARSQKAAQIRPPILPPLSFNTYMKIIRLSYQFFTLLRTMYFDH